jgi:hypothetical protein
MTDKAVTLQEITILCDTCAFKILGDIREYHGKPCPDCGAPNIIDDKDIVIYDGMVAMAELVNSMVEPNPDSPKLTVKVNSAEIKNLFMANDND